MEEKYGEDKNYDQHGVVTYFNDKYHVYSAVWAVDLTNLYNVI